jgi:hypothetical protein
LDQFIACWEGLEDPRTGNAGLHDFHELLMIALCTVLCGGQSAVAMARFAQAKEGFLRGFLKLENGLPSHDTFSRLFRLLDPDQFGAAFQRFMTALDVATCVYTRSQLGKVRNVLAELCGGADFQKRAYLYRFQLPGRGNSERVYTLGSRGRDFLIDVAEGQDWSHAQSRHLVGMSMAKPHLLTAASTARRCLLPGIR